MLLEFPPVIGGKRLYLLNDSGKLIAINKHNGRRLWTRKLGALAASSPAYADGVVYVVLLQRAKSGPGARSGRVVALDGKTGKIRWSRELASRSESSPLIVDDRLYFGSENGTVYALAARRRQHALALSRRRRGQGRAGALRRRALLRRLRRPGLRDPARERPPGLARDARAAVASGSARGNFYSTPAVAYGRVYIGNTDGRIYSFSAAGGKLAWSKSTGGYVYASPAVAQVPGGRPLVYAGSYSGRFYALDARSGAVRWSRGGNGRISGGASVIGDIVYYADLGSKRTIGLGARTRPQGVRARARLLQPGRVRRRDDLPHRLPRDVRAAAALDRGEKARRRPRASERAPRNDRRTAAARPRGAPRQARARALAQALRRAPPRARRRDARARCCRRAGGARRAKGRSAAPTSAA